MLLKISGIVKVANFPVYIDIICIRRERRCMEVNNMLRIRPFCGKHVSRREAKKVNSLLNSLTVPDRTELYKEAKEYESLVLKRRASRTGN